jgi:acetyl esterase/lipase
VARVATRGRTRAVAGAGAVVILAAVGFGAQRWSAGKDDGNAGSKGVTAPAQTLTDLAYAGTSPAQRLDLYLPKRTGVALAVVVVIHGGAFAGGDKRDEPQIVQAVTAAGFAAASINYRLSGEAPFPAGVQDAKAAVRWLRANAGTYGLDPERFAAWGTSAGGTLAALTGVTGSIRGEFDDDALGNPGISSSVSAVVAWYAPSDFRTMDAQFADGGGGCPGTPQPHDPPDSPESLWLRAPIQSVPERGRAASPISYLENGRKVPPFFLVHGEADCAVPNAQSRELADALKAHGDQVSLTLLPGLSHADPRIRDAQLGPSVDFLRGVLSSSGTSAK